MLAVSYGGGTNSTAMLVGMKERGKRKISQYLKSQVNQR